MLENDEIEMEGEKITNDVSQKYLMRTSDEGNLHKSSRLSFSLMRSAKMVNMNI